MADQTKTKHCPSVFSLASLRASFRIKQPQNLTTQLERNQETQKSTKISISLQHRAYARPRSPSTYPITHPSKYLHIHTFAWRSQSPNISYQSTKYLSKYAASNQHDLRNYAQQVQVPTEPSQRLSRRALRRCRRLGHLAFSTRADL